MSDIGNYILLTSGSTGLGGAPPGRVAQNANIERTKHTRPDVGFPQTSRGMTYHGAGWWTWTAGGDLSFRRSARAVGEGAAP
jgi:hypothetical protein